MFVSSYAAAKARLSSRKLKLEGYIDTYSQYLNSDEETFIDNLAISFTEKKEPKTKTILTSKWILHSMQM